MFRQVQLDYPDECLISISGYMDQWGPNYLVRSLTFESNKGVHGPYGLQEGTYFSSPPNIGKIVGFYGRCALYLNCIGAYFAPAFHMEPIRKIGPYGGEGGSPWDDGRHTGLRQVFLSCGLVIDSICCVYDTGEKSDQRGGSGESSLTVCLNFLAHYYLTG